MSNLQDLRVKLEQANKSIESLNSTSDANLANKNLLTKQFKEKCDAFEKKYGIKITAENIATVRQQIVAEKEKEYNTVASVLQAIQNGEIDKAYQLAGVERTDVTPVESVQEPVVQPATPVVELAQANQEGVVTPQPKVEPVTQSAEQPVVVQSSPEPSVQPVVKPVVQPTFSTGQGVNIQPTPTVVQPQPTHTKIVVPTDALDTTAEPEVVKAPVTMADLKNTGVGNTADAEKQDRINDFMATIGQGSNNGSALSGSPLGDIVNQL